MVDALFKAGFYYIGDPINVFREWDTFLGHINPNRDESLFEFRKQVIAVGNAKGGDGVYNDIRTDTGYIALVPAQAISKPDFDREAGLFIGFEEDFRVQIADGYFIFGDIEIETDDAEERFEEQLIHDREIWDDDDDAGWNFDHDADGW